MECHSGVIHCAPSGIIYTTRGNNSYDVYITVVILQLSLTVVIFYCNMFIIQATLPLFHSTSSYFVNASIILDTVSRWSNDTQHNKKWETQHNDTRFTQHNNSQHNNTQNNKRCKAEHNVIMSVISAVSPIKLSVVKPWNVLALLTSRER